MYVYVNIHVLLLYYDRHETRLQKKTKRNEKHQTWQDDDFS